MAQVSDEQAEILKDLVYEQKFFFGRDKLYQWLSSNMPEAGISRRMIANWLTTQEVYQRTKPPGKRQDSRSLNISREGFMNCDLIGPMFEEKGYRFGFTMLDVGTRKLFFRPIREKTAANIRDALIDIRAKENPKITVMKQDNGSEFKGEFLTYLDENGIKHFNSAPGQPWTNPVERAHRSIKQALYKYELATGKKNWVEPLQTIVENLNQTWHKSLKATPDEAKDLPDEIRLQRLRDYGKSKKRNNGKTAFNLGDIVRRRIPKGSKFEKQKETFSANTYIVSQIIRGNDSRMVTYKLSQDGDSHIAGTYNLTDLLLVSQSEAPNRGPLDPDEVQIGERSKQDQREVNELAARTEEVNEIRDSRHPDPDAQGYYIVERIVRKRKFGKTLKYEVKWRGYDSSFNTWQTARELSGAKDLLKAFQDSLKA